MKSTKSHDIDLLAALLVQGSLHKDNGQLKNLGVKMAMMKNDMGFPPDMFMARLDNLTIGQKLIVGDVYCQQMIEHKRASGSEEKALNRTRQHNQEILGRLMRTGEMGEF